MKSINKLAVAAVLALSSAGLASAAPTVYHVTGSTAFRVADVSAEVAICGGTNAYASYFGATSLTGAGQSVVQNASTLAASTVKFENNFTGSIAGDEALEAPIAIVFPTATGSSELPTQVTTAPSAPSTVAAGGNGQTSATGTETVAPDIAFSDVNPSTTAASIISGAASPDNVDNVSVNAEQVGVIPFVFVANGSSDTATEVAKMVVNPQNFTAAWSTGKSPLAIFTGVSTDTNTIVYPLGRDIDSGTRSTALAETGYTLAGSGSSAVTNPVVQYFPLDSTGAVIGNVSTLPISSFELVPTQVVDGITLSGGDGGFNSGGNLAKCFTDTFASGVTKSVEITYLGVSDATTALKSPTTAVLLPYAGSTFSPNTLSTTNENLILFGQYSFWGYEYLVYDNNGNGEAANFLTQLFTNHLDTLSSNGVQFQSMTVGRSDDGLNITPDYLP